MEFKGDSDTVCELDQRLQLALNGDQEALGGLFASHMPQLYRVALRVLGTPQDAEDALQDGLLDAMRHLGEFECRSRFSTWLTRIVINAALMQLRKSRREALTSIHQGLDRDEVPLADRITDPGPSPEEVYAWKERFQVLERKLRRLPAAYRSVLRLRYVQGMSTKEAAELLGLNTGTLKSRLRRARLQLGKQNSTAIFRPRTFHPIRKNAGSTTHRLAAESTEAVAQPSA